MDRRISDATTRGGTKLICVHCKDDITGNEQCPGEGCGVFLNNECLDCHNERCHGVITNQNIHIVGGSGGLDRSDEDPDAFAKAHDQQKD